LVTNIPLTKAFNGPQDLNRSEVIISAVTKSISEDLAHRVFPEATIKTFSSSQEAIEAVTGGKVHGYIEHEPITTFIALDNPDTVDEPAKGILTSYTSSTHGLSAMTPTPG